MKMKNLQIADFRSDHCCQPPKQMLKVMSEAQTGVDIFSDDKVTNDLQLKISSMFGKQSALFFPSAQMANLAVVLAMCKLGQEVILESESRICRKQGPELAMFAGVLTNNISGQKGMLDPVQVQKSIKSNKQMLVVAHTSMIIIQNPTSSGRVYPKKQLTQLSSICRKKQVHLHVDGSRIFHALAYYKFPPKQICDYYDTMTISFERSLSCPGGAVVIGSQDVIKKIKIKKKALGGSMGQTGIITAGCLWALDNLLPEIQRDNEIARFLAEKLFQIPDILIQPEKVESNLVYFSFKGDFPHQNYLKHLSQNKILLKKYEDQVKYRLVIHKEIRQKQILRFIEITQQFITLWVNSQKSEQISSETSSRKSQNVNLTEQKDEKHQKQKNYT